MRYTPSAADRAPVPATYHTEARYLGYREADRAQPYAHYFREVVDPVQPHVLEAMALGRQPGELGYTVEEAARRMSRPGYEPMETGWAALPGRRIMVSILTHMPGVSPHLWDWWFGWHGRQTARYKLWHPQAHYFTAMGEDRSGDRTLTDRQRYVGNVSYVDEYLGPDKSQLSVRFLDPTAVGFDEPGPDEAVIVARGGLSTAPISTAWLVHQVRPTEDGCEMRSRFFVNDVQVLPLPPHSVASRGGRALTTPVGRLAERAIRLKGPFTADQFGPVMVMHCAQEMNHLAGFLPRLHEEFKDVP